GAAVAVVGVAVVALLAGLDHAVPAAGADDRRVDDVSHGLADARLIAPDAPFGSPEGAHHLRVAVEERRIREAVTARGGGARRGAERGQGAGDLGGGPSRAGRVVGGGGGGPGWGGVGGAPRAGVFGGGLLAGVGEEDGDESGVGTQAALAARDRLAAAARDEAIDGDAGAVEATLGAVAARSRLDVCAGGCAAAGHNDVARETAPAGPPAA